MSTELRRTKRHQTPPPPPSPKILHFPSSRRTRRKQTKPTTNPHRYNPLLLLMQQKYQYHKGKLENLLDKENTDSPPTHGAPRDFSNPSSSSKSSALERRERVEANDFAEYFNGGGGGFEEEKWRFQAEILRAECKLLRMEKEFALKKLEKNRVKMERILRSALQTLVSGKKKIVEGKNVNAVLEEEIYDLEEKLKQLQKSSRIHKEYEVRNCNNFDKQACLLQRRLANLGALSNESSVKGNDYSISFSKCKTDNYKPIDVDMLRKKMEGLSVGILNTVEEEYNSIHTITTNCSVASSASTCNECPAELSNFSTRQLNQEPVMVHDNTCSGRCKAIIRRIVEQVRAETEQWSQMQEMLAEVRGEMEDLHASRDFWETRSYNADHEIQSLRRAVAEWKEKSIGYENKVDELQLELSVLKEEIQKSKSDLLPPVPPVKRLEKEKVVSTFHLKKNRLIDEEGYKCQNGVGELNVEEPKERTHKIDFNPLSLGKQLAKEKRMLLRRFKEYRYYDIEKGSEKEISQDSRRKIPYSNGVGIVSPDRSPLKDIGNSIPLSRQRSRLLFGFHSPENSRIRDIFRMM